MNELSAYRNFYFIGIGGIGMSALARHFNSHGFAVAGYDKTPSPLTSQMEAEGMKIHFEDSIDAIPELYKLKEETLVIFTPAVPKDHKELNYFRENGFEIKKRAEVLALLTHGKTTIAVAGTHGKTSTAAMIAHLLRVSNVPFYAFLGGISSNYRTNYLEPENDKADLIVVEADEYDRSFLRLRPDVAVITAVEPDHLDIYGTFDNLQDAYADFAGLVKPEGQLIINKEISLTKTPLARASSYSAHDKADYYADNIIVKDHKYHFDAVLGHERLENIEIGIPGRHNIENCIAAMAAVRKFIPDINEMREAMRSFKGVQRRFEVVVNTENCLFVDDYAHHPTEIEVTIRTVKELYPDKKITGIFQPHLFTRTRDLAAEFAQSLSLLDELYLMPIYPARELPIEGVTSELILVKSTAPFKKVIHRQEILDEMHSRKPEVLVTIGAGDIDRIVPELKKILTEGRE